MPISNGYREYDLTTGALQKQVTTGAISDVVTVNRSAQGTTLLANRAEPYKIVEIDSAGTNVNEWIYNNGGNGVMRLTNSNSFLFGSGGKPTELSRMGTVVWEQGGFGANPIFEIAKLRSGLVVASGGYKPILQFFDFETKVAVKSYDGRQSGDPSDIMLLGFQVLANDHIVAAKWLGHNSTNPQRGKSLLEYDTSGAIVWSYGPDTTLGGVVNVLVLDDLDTDLLHVKTDGLVRPMQATTGRPFIRSSTALSLPPAIHKTWGDKHITIRGQTNSSRSETQSGHTPFGADFYEPAFH